MKCFDNFIFILSYSFVLCVILSVNDTNSQQNEDNIGQKTTISALKFTGNSSEKHKNNLFKV